MHLALVIAGENLSSAAENKGYRSKILLNQTPGFRQ